MIGGAFTKLELKFNNDQDGNWGINGDYVEASWKVSPKKIEFDYYTDNNGKTFDNFSIRYY